VTRWRYTWRATHVAPWLLGAAISLLLALVHSHGPVAAPLQIGAFLLGAGAGFVTDDPAAETLAPSPTTLRARQGLRVAGAALATALAAVVLASLARPSGIGEAGALVAMTAGILGLNLGVSGVAGRRRGWRHGGLVSGPAVLFVVIASSALPPQWRLLPTGDIPGGWPAICTRWALASLLGLLLLAYSLRDPARSAVNARWWRPTA
jgi:hypothetical protein